MEPVEFKQFMKEQAEHFAKLHGDCKDITTDQISEDSLEFRRRWSTSHINKDIKDERPLEQI